MTTSMLLAMILAQPETRCPPREARAVVQAARMAATHHRVPATLLLSVVLAETGCSNQVARGRGKGKMGCDVGYSQIHVPLCDPLEVAALVDPRSNLDRAAFILSASRSRCARSRPPGACRISPWALYNPGSTTWWRRVRELWRRLRRDDSAV